MSFEMYSYENQYLDRLMILTVLAQAGDIESDRTGVGTTRMFGTQLKADLRQGFPLLTTKKVFPKGVIAELLWFLRGETNSKILEEQGVNIWREWATEDGELGPIYGEMWRSWPTHRIDMETNNIETIDQIQCVIHRLRKNPTDRRLIVSAWNPALLPNPNVPPSRNAAMGLQALPPCHTMFQFAAARIPLHHQAEEFGGENAFLANAGTVPEYYLDLQLYQRSADWMLGVPFNVASYALLQMIIARMVNMVPRNFIHTFGDYHLYSNHIEQAREQLGRAPRSMPKMQLKFDPDIKDPAEIQLEDFELTEYNPHPAIKAPVAV